MLHPEAQTVDLSQVDGSLEFLQILAAVKLRQSPLTPQGRDSALRREFAGLGVCSYHMAMGPNWVKIGWFILRTHVALPN